MGFPWNTRRAVHVLPSSLVTNNGDQNVVPAVTTPPIDQFGFRRETQLRPPFEGTRAEQEAAHVCREHGFVDCGPDVPFGLPWNQPIKGYPAS